jgi:hypothetical protein
MLLDFPIPSSRAVEPLRDALEHAKALECDWCGKAVRPETAVRRPGGDGAVVVLCTECEFGTE